MEQPTKEQQAEALRELARRVESGNLSLNQIRASYEAHNVSSHCPYDFVEKLKIIDGV